MRAICFWRLIFQSFRLLLTPLLPPRLTLSLMSGNLTAYFLRFSLIIFIQLSEQQTIFWSCIISSLLTLTLLLLLLSMKKDKNRPRQIYLQRIKCNCMAQKHELINNCLNCGKVVCAQEGEGNCLYCGKLVTRPQGLFIDDTTTFFPSLNPQEQQQAAQERSKAIQHKNVLVGRDKTIGQQNIFDEQVDYYQISENKWLDQEDRQHAIDRILATGNEKEEERFKTNVKLDPLTGQFVREQFQFDEEAFKKEGQKYLQGLEKDQKTVKEKTIKQKHNWDQRILRSQKLRDLCADLIGDSKDQPVPVKQVRKTTDGTTEMIVEQ